MQDYPQFWHYAPHGPPQNPYWIALQSLLKLSFWKRAWVFQEVCLPPDAVLMYGSSFIELSALLTTVRFMYHIIQQQETQRWEWYFAFLPDRILRRLIIDMEYTIALATSFVIEAMNVREQLADERSDCPTLTLVPRLVRLQATDPRDHIFGFLGVLKTSLRADYNRDVHQIYLELASIWIHEIQNVEFLLDSGSGSNEPLTELPLSICILTLPFNRSNCETLSSCLNNKGILHTDGILCRPKDFRPYSKYRLPSWAPNWEAKRREPDSSFFRNVFHSSENLPVDVPKLSNSHRLLTITGVACSTVVEIFPPSDYLDSFGQLSRYFLRVAEEFIRMKLKRRRDLACFHPFYILFRAANLDRHPSREKLRLLDSGTQVMANYALAFLFVVLYGFVLEPPLSFGETFATRIRRVVYEVLPVLDSPPGREFAQFWKETFFQNIDPVTHVWKYAVDALIWARSNCKAEIETLMVALKFTFVSTCKFLAQDGSIGITRSTCPGDQIVVLSGCDVTILLRKKNVDYEHVGPCYVFGLMDGEAKEEVDLGGLGTQTFHVR